MGVLFISCSSRQTVDNLSKDSINKVTFKVVEIDTAYAFSYSYLNASDSLNPQLSGYKRPGDMFSPRTEWYAFLPYKDTLSVWIESLNSTVIPGTSNIQERGYYLIKYDSIHVKSGIYYLNFSFCDTLLRSKTIIMR